MVNPREQPPLPPQPQLFSPSSGITRSGSTRRQRDWELLPTPCPWKSLDGINYRVNILFGAIFFIMALCSMFAFLLAYGIEVITILPPVISFGMGTTLILYVHNRATDGVETWLIELPVDTGLFHAIDRSIGPYLESKGYGNVRLFTKSGQLNGTDYESLDCRIYVYKVPMVRMTDNEYKAKDSSLTIHFYFWFAGKFQTPRFDFELEGVRPKNYAEALVLQKDVVWVLKSQNCRSVNRILAPKNRPKYKN